MERFRGVISLGAYRQERLLREQAQKVAEIAKVHRTVEEKLAAERKRYADLSDEAYTSRAEARESIAFLSRLSRKVAKSRPGAPLDLTHTIVDYGFDAEAEAADLHSGIPYVSDADREEAAYHLHLSGVSHLFSSLERAGVSVLTGVKRVFPDDE
jgi:hypothetical protein